MNPLAVLARLGPFLGRLAKASPAVFANLVNRLRGAGAVVEASVPSVLAYAKAHPLNTALVFTTLADLGASVFHLFSEQDKKDPTVADLAQQVKQIEDSVSDKDRSEAHTRVLDVAAKSQGLDLGFAKKEKDVAVLEEVCTWAQGFFGSRRAAMDAHSALQAFMELPRTDVEFAFNHLRLGR